MKYPHAIFKYLVSLIILLTTAVSVMAQINIATPPYLSDVTENFKDRFEYNGWTRKQIVSNIIRDNNLLMIDDYFRAYDMIKNSDQIKTEYKDNISNLLDDSDNSVFDSRIPSFFKSENDYIEIKMPSADNRTAGTLFITMTAPDGDATGFPTAVRILGTNNNGYTWTAIENQEIKNGERFSLKYDDDWSQIKIEITANEGNIRDKDGFLCFRLKSLKLSYQNNDDSEENEMDADAIINYCGFSDDNLDQYLNNACLYSLSNIYNLFDDDPSTVWDSRIMPFSDLNNNRENDHFEIQLPSHNEGDILKIRMRKPNPDLDQSGFPTNLNLAPKFNDKTWSESLTGENWNWSVRINQFTENNGWVEFTVTCPQDWEKVRFYIEGNNSNTVKENSNYYVGRISDIEIWFQDKKLGAECFAYNVDNAKNDMTIESIISVAKDKGIDVISTLTKFNENIGKIFDKQKNTYWDSASDIGIQYNDGNQYFDLIIPSEYRGRKFKIYLQSPEDLPGQPITFWYAHCDLNGNFNWNGTTDNLFKVSADLYTFDVQSNASDSKIRFYVTDNLGNYTWKNEGENHAMRIAEMNILMYNPDYVFEIDDIKKYEQNYNPTYSNYSFTHTHGIVEKNYGAINNPKEPYDINENEIIKSDQSEDDKESNDDWLNLEYWDENGKCINNDLLVKTAMRGVTFPEFDYITESDQQQGWLIDGIQGVRQRTNTIIHEIYALPGDRVDLYPYSDIYADFHYAEDFSRWYDYRTDKVSPYLQFFTNPEAVSRSEYGFYAGKALFGEASRAQGAVASFYYPINPANPDETVPEIWIAADFSMKYHKNKEARTYQYKDENGNPTIIEPIIHMRHLFHIRSGKVQASQISESHEANKKYVKGNRRMISARHGVKFTIRLDEPLPVNDDARSPIYYKNPNYNPNSDSGYDKYQYLRIRSCEIEAYKYSDYKMYENSGERPEPLKLDGANIFKIYDESKFNHLIPDIKTNLDNDRRWPSAGTQYFRGIECGEEVFNDLIKKNDEIIIRLIAHGADGKRIKLNGQDLILKEYIVTFLDDSKASFVPENEIDDENYKYQYQRESYLDSHYPDPLVIDYDKYAVYEDWNQDFVKKKDNITIGVSYANQNGWGDVTQVEGGEGSFLKIPLSWNRSSYTFGYHGLGVDFNIYNIANHSSVVAYRNAATKRTAQYNRDMIKLRGYTGDDLSNVKNGVYDRHYYDTGGKEQGYFFYVNAAGDPGDMAYIHINKDQLCLGSTLYVSAWVNEFSDGVYAYESANVTFNFVAKIKSEYQSKYGKSQVNIHSFTTGYVDRGGKLPGYDFTGQEGRTDGFFSGWSKQSSVDIASGTNENYWTEENTKNGTTQLSGQQGKWMHVYYSFVPDMNEIDVLPEEIERYELILENNSVSSVGADYAIDQIKVFIVEPKAEVIQETPVCTDQVELDNLRVNVSFRSLLSLMGIQEGESPDADRYLYYAFLDKDIYDKSIAAGNSSDVAFSSAIDRIKVNSSDEKYGCILFHDQWGNNQVEQGETGQEHALRENPEKTKGIEYLYFYTTLEDESTDKIFSGKEYYFTYYASSDKLDEANIASQLSIADECSKKSVLTVKGTTIIKIDGIYQQDATAISCCENQHPVVQLDLRAQKEHPDNDDEMELVTPSAHMDWFVGRYEELRNLNPLTIGDKTLPLREVLIAFHEDYPESSDWNMPVFGEEGAEASKYSEYMRDYLKGLCEPKLNEQGEVIESPQLYLYQSSYIFPAVKLGETETYRDLYVTAIPVDTRDIIEIEGQGYVICSEPTEVKMRVSNVSPKLVNGLKGMDYPELMDDVPLRIGLKQLNSVSNTGETDNKTLVMPLRFAENATPGVTILKNYTKIVDDTDQDDMQVYLAKTNDPAYRILEEMNPDGKYLEKNESEKGKGLLPVGQFLELNTNVNRPEDKPLRIVFNTNAIKFKEGYYYTFKFYFEEDLGEMSSDDGDNSDYLPPCNGETVFTIKVVPEYQKWTGSEGVNWNNDANWSRVSSEELLVDGDVRKNDLGEYITDGSNLNAKSYAPLDFTKVIIPAGANYPQLAARAQVRGGNDDNASKANTAQPISVNNGYGSGNQEFIWNGVSPKSVSPVEGNLQNESDGDGFAPTDNIQFDMAAVTYTGDGNVYCRPWYANAAAEVHFNTNAEILNQQHLDYQKAWVDMEMTPGRWYTAAMPLQRTFAGDMYAPTAGARQETELFTEIRFDNDGKLNDRFAPAVYQRGWDKGDETVYELPSTSNSETRPVAIAANWSHVYNDVAVAYEPGSGFSVKSDVSRIQGFGDDNYVKFRFPKADERYLYQEDGQLPSGEENGGTENIRDKRNNLSHRLVTLDGESKYSVTVKKADNGKFFLVGNPFMSHLDMAKFFEVNTGIAPKYWIMSGDSQLAAVMDKDSNGFYGKADEVTVRDFRTVPPMQGFFVEANKNATELTLTFTQEMMKVEAYSPTAVDGVSINRPLLTSTRSGDGEVSCYGDDVVTVSAGGSVALLRMNPVAAKGYDVGEDVEWLDDSNQRGVTRVYTVAGDMAVSINQTPDFEGIGIGVAAASEEEETELRFDGELIDGFKLLDTKTGEVSELQPGFTMTVEGSASGRFFLTRSSNVDRIIEDAIKIYKESSDLVVKAPEMCGAVTVRIYDPTGRMVSTVVDSGAEIRVALTAGIYIVEVRGSESGRKTAKLRF